MGGQGFWGRERWMDVMLFLGVVLIVAGVAIDFGQEKETEVEVIKAKKTVGEETEKEEEEVVVDVGGEVIKPGVYRLETGSRVNEALAAAGGLAAGADRGWVEKNINRAAMAIDGMKIYIPKTGEEVKGVTEVAGEAAGVVSLNRATIKELEELPGVGEVMAGRIVDYREKNGGFREINELKLVKGIGEKLFEKIRERVSL